MPLIFFKRYKRNWSKSGSWIYLLPSIICYDMKWFSHWRNQLSSSFWYDEDDGGEWQSQGTVAADIGGTQSHVARLPKALSLGTSNWSSTLPRMDTSKVLPQRMTSPRYTDFLPNPLQLEVERIEVFFFFFSKFYKWSTSETDSNQNHFSRNFYR